MTKQLIAPPVFRTIKKVLSVCYVKCCSKEDQNRCCPLCHAEKAEKEVADSLSDHAAHTEITEHQQNRNSKHGKQNNFCAHSLVHRLTDCVFPCAGGTFCGTALFRRCFSGRCLGLFLFCCSGSRSFFLCLPASLCCICHAELLPFLVLQQKISCNGECPDKKTVQSKIFSFRFFTTRIRMRIVKVTGKCRHENRRPDIPDEKQFYFFPWSQFQRSLPR